MREAFGATFDLPLGYVNTASIGVPPASTTEAVAESVRRWGRAQDDSTDFNEALTTSRQRYAALVGVPTDRVALGASVSELIGMIAASLPDGASVLTARQEFTSVSFPFAAQQDRGITIAEADLDDVAELAPRFDVVAVSAVQSANGAMVDLAALRAAAEETSTRVLLDLTQAAGWLPLSVAWADWTVAAGYKWLMAPRGAAWLTVGPGADALRPHNANWFAADASGDPNYGLPMRLAPGVRGLDQSPTWFAHVGAANSLSWLTTLDLDVVAAHCVDLANTFRAGVGLAALSSPIVAVDIPGAVEDLTRAGVRCSDRAGRARLSFHLYNSLEDVDLALGALKL